MNLRSLALLPLVLAASCRPAGGRGAGLDHPERLDGRWAMALRLESPIQLDGDTTGTVTGELSLIDDPAARGPRAVVRRPTHYGVYAADFSRFGFVPRTGRVPTAVARLLGADSVEVVLDPDADGVRLAGGLRGDSIAGHWSYDGGRLTGAAGRFVMRRREGRR